MNIKQQTELLKNPFFFLKDYTMSYFKLLYKHGLCIHLVKYMEVPLFGSLKSHSGLLQQIRLHRSP